ncbi:MAG: TetR/AcrR family transcriptional regulator [Anaerolineales bacterium]|nr:TetR/AcrR family transcriptional regulator [Anaerolineales bacterium]MDP3186336.1 TetR/AcrR family transcriptional regulator [Anaerolineales bacterium]
MPDEETLTKGERTRRAVMDAAYRLFMEQGFHATSMRQIADRAGLALGGIYNYFRGKDEVFVAVLLDHHPYRQIIPLLRDAPGETVDEFVHSAARAMIAELGRQPDFLNLMFIEIVEFEGRHVPMLFDTIFPDIQPLMQRFLQASGNLRPIPLPILLRAFLGMFFSYYITEILIGHSLPREMQENALEHFAEIFLHGILSKS